MPQAKISAFFKLKTHDPTQTSSQIDGRVLSSNIDPMAPVTYARRQPKTDVESDNNGEAQLVIEEMSERKGASSTPSLRPHSGEVLNKKRNYAQFHLELGQSDFLLHTCIVCGLIYARGDYADEKVHKAYHKDYYQGIQFKGWRNERVVFTGNSSGDRAVLVLDGDPPARKHKVHQVTKMVEKELGFSDDRLIHKLCKIYLFISSHRIVGCLVAEPIRTAHRVISSPLSCENSNDDSMKLSSPKGEGAETDLKRPNPSTLQFGNFSFQREVIRKDCSNQGSKVDHWDSGAILCEEGTVPAICGIRAVWVAPSSRRKRIASQLLDAARKSFSAGQTLEASQCAFSSPTSSGKAFASSYTRSNSFLIYREDNV